MAEDNGKDKERVEAVQRTPIVHAEENNSENRQETLSTKSPLPNEPLATPQDNDQSAMQKDRDFGSFKYYRKTYLTIVIIISAVTILIFGFISWHYNSNTEKIIKIQQKDYDNIEQIIGSQKRLKYDEKKLLIEVFERHENRMNDIMEMQHAKLEADFNFISIWAAALTIVFLVFSIYSIFKTDEMLNRAEEESKRLHKMYQEANKEVDNLENFIQSSTLAANNSFADIQSRLSIMNSKISREENNLKSKLIL